MGCARVGSFQLASSSSNSTFSTTPTSSVAPTDSSGAVVMPLELMGASTDQKDVPINIPQGSTAISLRMQANNLSYDNKASVQVNDGPWISLTNANTNVEGNGKIYGGIGGAYNTITLSVAITGAVDGANTIHFKFNGTDGISSGFRVLQFNLRDTNSTDLIAASSFSQDDPTQWTAPLTSAADISEGEVLWRTGTLYESPINASHTLNAHCMDCHSQDGRDLHRFNYSNNAIITRSMHHGLSQVQGQQIASYIRSLAATLGVPGDNCRPWNPPYQPGPGLDSLPLADWTCGAGLSAVLENDSDSLSSIFPSGINKTAIVTSGHINIREIPIAFQLPDWKHWLPRIHPKDAYGDTFVNSNLNKMYNNEGTGSYNQGSLRANLAAGPSDYVLGKVGDFTDNYYYWGVEWGERFTAKGDPTVIADQKNMYSAAQWLVVKNWELAQEFGLESLCPQNWAQRGGMASKIEPRSWCGYWRFVFDVSPHILGFPDTNNMFGSQVHDLYVANQWYYLAVLLNPGSGAHNVHLPTDWQYAYGLFDNLAEASGRSEPVRKLLYVTKGTQEVDNGVGVVDMNRGWTFRTADPTAVWSGGGTGMWQNVPAATKNAAFNAYLETWLDRTESFPQATWQRIDGVGGDGWCGWSEYRLCWLNYVPGTLVGINPTIENFATWSYNQIPQMRADGIDPTLLNRYATVMNVLYPSGGFLNLVK